MLCAKYGLKCPSGTGEEDIKKFAIMYFYYFAIFSNLRRVWPFIRKKTESSSPKDALCIFTISQFSPFFEGCGPSFEQTWIPFTQECFVPSLVDQWFWRIFFLKFSMYFYYFTIISPLRRALSFIWWNLNPHHLLCAKFGWN